MWDVGTGCDLPYGHTGIPRHLDEQCFNTLVAESVVLAQVAYAGSVGPAVVLGNSPLNFQPTLLNHCWCPTPPPISPSSRGDQKQRRARNSGIQDARFCSSAYRWFWVGGEQPRQVRPQDVLTEPLACAHEGRASTCFVTQIIKNGFKKERKRFTDCVKSNAGTTTWQPKTLE